MMSTIMHLGLVLLPVVLILAGSIICLRRSPSLWSMALLLGTVVWMAGLGTSLVAHELLISAEDERRAATRDGEYAASRAVVTLLEVGSVGEMAGSILFAVAFIGLVRGKTGTITNSTLSDEAAPGACSVES